MKVEEFLKQSLGICVVNPKVIFDVGADDGARAQEFAEMFPKANIFAFEARRNGAAIARHRLANHKNVTVVEAACHEVDGGQVPFYQAADPRASSLFRIDERFKDVEQTEMLVNTVRMDLFAKAVGVQHVDMVWMDVEGSELYALRGMGKLLDTVRAMRLEVTFGDRWLDHAGLNYIEVDEYLEKHEMHQLQVYKQNKHLGEAIYIRQPLKG